MEKKNEIEERLITFASSIITITESLPRSLVADHVAEEFVKRGINPLFSYAEAQHSDSRTSFIEKMQVSTDSLRGTINFLKVATRITFFIAL